MTRTNAYTILCVLIRAGAALFFASTMAGVAVMLMSDLGAAAEIWTNWLVVPSFGLSIVASVLLWLYPDWIARIALARKTGEVFESELDQESWQTIVNGAIGLYFIGQGLGWATRQVLTLLVHVRAGEGVPLVEGFWSGVAATVATLAFGFWLLLGARGLARWVMRLRGRDAPLARESQEVPP